MLLCRDLRVRILVVGYTCDIHHATLFYPHQFALPFGDILVIPLYVFRFLDPTFHIRQFDFSRIGENNRSVPELSRSGLQFVIVKAGTTPEHEPNSGLEYAVADGWFAIQKPNRVAMPNLAFCFRQQFVN